MAATASKTVPLVSSSTTGPLGVAHLPRLWTKLTLNAHGALVDGYDICGQGFDQMTLDALGLDRAETLKYVDEKHPTYMQFEKYILEKNGGAVSKEKIAAHNAAVLGYDHVPERGAAMRKASGNEHDHVTDAVTLNTIEDLDELHAQFHA